jgi:hypothetical protein
MLARLSFKVTALGAAAPGDVAGRMNA